MGRTRAAARLPKRSVALRVESARSWPRSLREAAEPSRPVCPGGQRHEFFAVEPLLPCLRHLRAVADKGFDADTFRARLCRQRTRICIPREALSPLASGLSPRLLPAAP